MTDSGFDTNTIITIIAIIIYIVIISVAIGRFHSYLEKIKLANAKVRLEMLSETEAKTLIISQLQGIRVLKKRSYIVLFSVGLTHILISVILGSDVLSYIVPFLLFSFILFGNYWLKGSTVISHLRFRWDQTDYHWY